MGKLSDKDYYQQRLSVRESANAYARLRKNVLKQGILDRDYFYYSKLFVLVIIGLSLGLYFLIVSQSFVSIFVSGLFFTFFAMQITGIFHDAGHRAIFKSTRNNDITGYFCCAILAYTYRKWRVNHNKHHANPNEEEMDPDIERPMFSFNKKQLKAKKSLWYFLSKKQVFFYYPIGTLTGIYSQIANVIYFIRESEKTSFWEKAVYVAGIIFWIFGPILTFGAAKAFIIYFTVYPLFGLYLFNVFAPNHKGMPQIKKGQKISFLEQQLVTARNIKGGFFTDIILLGLNYQIEHHLFPDCPRNKLKLLTVHVKALCRETGLEYTETNLIESNRIILRELDNVASTS